MPVSRGTHAQGSEWERRRRFRSPLVGEPCSTCYHPTGVRWWTTPDGMMGWRCSSCGDSHVLPLAPDRRYHQRRPAKRS